MYEKDVAAGGFDFLAHIEEILSLLFEDFVHLAVIVYDDSVVHLCKIVSSVQVLE